MKNVCTTTWCPKDAYSSVRRLNQIWPQQEATGVTRELGYDTGVEGEPRRLAKNQVVTVASMQPMPKSDRDTHENLLSTRTNCATPRLANVLS